MLLLLLPQLRPATLCASSRYSISFKRKSQLQDISLRFPSRQSSIFLHLLPQLPLATLCMQASGNRYPSNLKNQSQKYLPSTRRSAGCSSCFSLNSILQQYVCKLPVFDILKISLPLIIPTIMPDDALLPPTPLIPSCNIFHANFLNPVSP